MWSSLLLLSEEEVVLRAVKEARACQAAQKTTRNPINRSEPSRKFCSTSLATPGISCFVDAAWDERSGNGGMGWVFTNRPTGLALQDSTNRRHVSSALTAETLAVKAALSAAVLSGLRSLTRCSRIPRPSLLCLLQVASVSSFKVCYMTSICYVPSLILSPSALFPVYIMLRLIP